MRKLLTILLCAITASTFAQKPAKQGTLNYLDEKRGFKTLILGSDISSHMAYLSESEEDSVGGSTWPGVKFYKVTDSDFSQVGDVRIQEVTVGAFNNKLAIIFLKMKKPNGENLFSIFKTAYGGNFSKSNQFMDSYSWKSKNVYLNVDYDGLTEDSAIMVDLPLFSEMSKAEKEANKKAVSDL